MNHYDQDDPTPGPNIGRRIVRWSFFLLMVYCVFVMVSSMARLKAGTDFPALRAFMLSTLVFIISFSAFYLIRE